MYHECSTSALGTNGHRFLSHRHRSFVCFPRKSNGFREINPRRSKQFILLQNIASRSHAYLLFFSRFFLQTRRILPVTLSLARPFQVSTAPKLFFSFSLPLSSLTIQFREVSTNTRAQPTVSFKRQRSPSSRSLAALSLCSLSTLAREQPLHDSHDTRQLKSALLDRKSLSFSFTEQPNDSPSALRDSHARHEI
jgi:hypothetical protein